MKIESQMKNQHSEPELRQDPVSGDWIIIAPGRGTRPHMARGVAVKRKKSPKKGCPFEDPQASGNSEPVLVYPNKENWQVQVLENKYPALRHHDVCATPRVSGPFERLQANGHHDVIITRDHQQNFPRLSPNEANQLFQAFRDRYLTLSADPCIEYAFFFHNWGPAAGASVYHPHYQVIALPVVPPDVHHSLEGSRRFFEEKNKCVHCEMILWEQKDKARVIFENDKAIAFAPFVSRSPYEVRIFPKQHQPNFESALDSDVSAAVEALQFTLRKMEKNLGDPDYNFFLHTAPMKEKDKYGHYHWHIEVIPRLNIRASFELGTGVEINDVDPDAAAKILRK